MQDHWASAPGNSPWTGLCGSWSEALPFSPPGALLGCVEHLNAERRGKCNILILVHTVLKIGEVWKSEENKMVWGPSCCFMITKGMGSFRFVKEERGQNVLVCCFSLVHLSLNSCTKPLGQTVQSTLTFQAENPLQATADSDIYLHTLFGGHGDLLTGNCPVLASYSSPGVELFPGYALLPWSLPHRHLYLCNVHR